MVSCLLQAATDDQKREDMGIPVQSDVESDHRVPCSPQHRPDHLDTSMASSMSRRNLETIVEAIRHLEGEGEITLSEHKSTVQCVNTSHRLTESVHQKFYIPKGAESDELSYVTSDQEEMKSESSGRDSPSSRHYVRLHSAQNLQPLHPTSAMKLTESKAVVTSSSYSEKYPAVTNVLQGHSPQLQMYCRPGVIVQKS